MKRLVIFFVVLLLFPSIFALNLDVKKVSSGEVMIAGLDKPAKFVLEITNNGPEENLEFYNLLGFAMYPAGTVHFDALEKKTVDLEIYPIGDFDHMGSFTFPYYIKNQDDAQIQQSLTFRRIKLADAFEIGGSEINPEENTVSLYIKNLENFDFGEVEASFSSAFFDFDKKFELGPKETKEFTVDLNKDEISKLLAGFYTMKVEISVDNQKTTLEDNLEFIEKSYVKTEEQDSGIIIRTNTITKTNEGNVLSDAEIKLQKSIISKLFTTMNPEPTISERSGFYYYYTWSDELAPGEELVVKSTTNWLIPLLIVLLIVAVVIIARQYAKTNLVLKKKVSFVRAKGGEFALKISVFVNAKKYIEKVRVVDRLPSLAKLYEKFGIEKPSRVDEKLKRLEWNFEKLESGEVRVLSYIIYSKVGVLGKFALPKASAIYEKDGVIHEAESNRAYFISEQRTKDVEEE